MALILHRRDDPTALADQLAQLLAEAPLDVFARELVVAPSAGVERWLTQRLSHRLGATLGDDGVCAGLDVRTPHTFISLLLGRENDDPWHPDRLAWAVLAAMDECVSRSGFEALARHLGADAVRAGEDPWWHRARQSRRYAVARRVAGLFARYADDRPELMRAWEAGRENDLVDPDHAWQAPLWRTVVERVLACGSADASPVQRLDRTLADLRAGTAPSDLPERVSFFGYTRMPAAMLDLLEALGQVCDVHVWLPHPSPALWAALAENPQGIVARRDDASAEAAAHPLLATLGRDIREVEAALLARSVVDATDSGGGESRDASRATPTRLALMQDDIRADRAPSSVPSVPEDDRSVQIHVCHGAARQVEALRETLLWLVSAEGGNLEPRDIVVMCPDVETYAPLIKATFAAVDEHDHHPGRRLRVQLADRAVSATNPLAEAAQRLVELVTSRVTASQVLDFAGLPAVAEKFGFDTDALERIARWVRTTEARWGLDAQHRGEYSLGGLENNTWAQALDRLALGVAMSADTDAAASQFVPVDDLGSSDIAVAEAFVALLTKVSEAAWEIRRVSAVDPALPRASFTPEEWFAWLRRNVLAVAAPARDMAWQRAEFERELSFLETGSASGAALRITDVRVMLEQRWGPRRTRSNFRNGAVSVCTLTPMRSVPHKAVVLLGLDDDTFPRAQVVDGDDVLARHPLVGERDARSEDRQLLLDALMAAQHHFIAFYSGFDERGGTRRPPAVPLQEIISAAARTGTGESPAQNTAQSADEGAPFEHLHPLQAFDERNFVEASPLPGGSYDAAALQGARALREFHADPLPRPALLSEPLAPAPPTDVTLDDLTSFLENPARTFLRSRLQIGVTYETEEVEDGLPIQLDPLEKWAVGDRVLRQVLSGRALDRALADERRRGSLPPDLLKAGRDDAATIERQVRGVLEGLPPGDRTSHDIHLDLALPPSADGAPSTSVRLTGVVPGVIGDEIQVVNYGSVNARHLASGWVKVLALAACFPDRTWRAAVRGRSGSCVLTVDSAEARESLVSLVLNRGYGLRAPLPVPAKTGLAYVEGYRAAMRSANPNEAKAVERGLMKARREWESSYEYTREDANEWWSRVFEGRASLARLDAQGRFTLLAPRLWGPIVDHRQELSS